GGPLDQPPVRAGDHMNSPLNSCVPNFITAGIHVTSVARKVVKQGQNSLNNSLTYDSQEKLIVTVYLPPLSGYVFGPAYTRRETPGPNCSLQIENLNQDDSGTYTVTKDGPSVHGRGNLSLLPKPNMSLVQLFRENMDLVHLKCDTTVKFANISWLQNGKPLRSCSRIQLSNNKQTLTIQPVLRRDAGAYQCHISNLFSARRSDTTIISNLPKPNVIVKPTNFLMEFQPVWLYCNTTIIQEVSWFKDNILLGKGYDFTDFNRSLHVASVSPDNTGQYWCQVSNGITVVKSYPVFLSVIYGPGEPIISPPTQRYYNEHTKVLLTCKADSFPQPRYVWFHNGKKIDTGPKLFLEDFVEDKTGSYICQAGNDLLQKKRNSSSLEIYLEKSDETYSH
uniref:Ig-like domain-containing protein n=1 Tax=Pseudonaja textilis TaxID=8673 RepID=A0A670ZY28_PSETE